MTKPMPKVAMIGAGISGLICARMLADQGSEITLFEKSRGVGGRMATRRVNDGVSFDHGAQYFTARDDRFLQQVNTWEREGLVEKWNGRIVSLTRGVVDDSVARIDRYVGVPGMTSIARKLSQGLTVRNETRVGKLIKQSSQWELRSDQDAMLGMFDVVLSCAPPMQTGELFAGHTDLVEKISSVQMLPCWAMMLQLLQPLEVSFDGAFVQESTLGWIARNSSKPQRNADLATWVMHATPAWSTEHLELSPDEVRPLMMAAFGEATHCEIDTPFYTAPHRWRYSIPACTLSDTALWDATSGLGASGDWCGGPRVEGAFLSGVALAERVMG